MSQRQNEGKSTDSESDLSEKEQVTCHTSALALAMTDEARREAEM